MYVRTRLFSSRAFALSVAGSAMALVVVLSNWLMQAGAQGLPLPFTALNQVFATDVFIYGQFTFPIAFLITDIINRVFGPARAGIVIAVGAIFGGLASLYYATALIAVASISAFVIGQILDVAVFQRLRDLAWFWAPLASSLLASAVDTGVFYGIAFSFHEPWVLPTAAMDFAVKACVALVALLPFRVIVVQMLSRAMPS